MREKVRKFLARHRRNWLVGKIGRNLGYFHQGFENQDYDSVTNGEAFVLRSLGRIHPNATILDVGANSGDWSMLARSAVPRATIHAIEVIPATFAKLADAAARVPQVKVHNLGLGEANGVLKFSVAKDRDDLSSGLAGVHGDFHKFEFYTVECPVMTGDDFCLQQNLAHIDFVKIDVEGLEAKVLKGFARMLDEQRIGAVQFEYGQLNLKARFFLEDFYELFGRYGMKIGRIFPDYVDFRDYHFTNDTLTGPNFLAVSEHEVEWMQALK